ncbi:MAG: tyrosine--tRNA ligase, partial [Clostridia bacterium]|nr:tyrosine--tRNA ligase [Clostridia bacterium]
TEKGAVWLDAATTSPYDFYQYWRNVDDADVIKCLKLLTFVPMDQVNEMATWQDARINDAKKVLAFELTKIVHGEEEAIKAKSAADALFGQGTSSENMPTVALSKTEIGDGLNILDILMKTGLIPSKGEGKRLIQQGGLSVNNEKIDSFDRQITMADVKDNEMIIRKGKKSYHRIVVE